MLRNIIVIKGSMLCNLFPSQTKTESWNKTGPMTNKQEWNDNDI